MKYRYTDWSKGPVLYVIHQRTRGGYDWPKHAGEVVFETEAANILEADAKMLAATGIDPAKRVDIGCSLP